jgi:hypothetical protein
MTDLILDIRFPRYMALREDMLAKALEIPVSTDDNDPADQPVPGFGKALHVKAMRQQIQLGLTLLSGKTIPLRWDMYRRLQVVQKENGVEVTLGDQEYPSEKPSARHVAFFATAEAWEKHKKMLLDVPEQMQKIFAVKIQSELV